MRIRWGSKVRCPRIQTPLCLKGYVNACPLVRGSCLYKGVSTWKGVSLSAVGEDSKQRETSIAGDGRGRRSAHQPNLVSAALPDNLPRLASPPLHLFLLPLVEDAMVAWAAPGYLPCVPEAYALIRLYLLSSFICPSLLANSSGGKRENNFPPVLCVFHVHICMRAHVCWGRRHLL